MLAGGRYAAEKTKCVALAVGAVLGAELDDGLLDQFGGAGQLTELDECAGEVHFGECPPGVVSELVEERGALSEVVGRVDEVAGAEFGQPEGVERNGFAELVTELASDVQRLGVVADRFVELLGGDAGHAEAVVHFGHAALVVDGSGGVQAGVGAGEPGVEEVVAHVVAAGQRCELPREVVEFRLACGGSDRRQEVVVFGVHPEGGHAFGVEVR